MSRYPAFLVDRLIPALLRGEKVQRAAQFLAGATEAACLPPAICPSPVFVLSAGWRSGSTLLQRLVCSGPKVILWGEPFEDLAPVHRLAASIEMLDADSPHLSYTPDKIKGSLSDNWIANLNPGVQALLQAHRAYFEALFAAPSQENGFGHWGAKYVRLSAFHAHYLKWLYPNARIVLLVRHPLAAFRSYKRLTWWYTVRPEFRVDSVWKFMSHWAYLANSFVEESKALGALLVRYEDLREGHPILEQLADYLDFSFDPTVLAATIGSRKKSRFRITPIDRIACRIITGRLCRELGYAGTDANLSPGSASGAIVSSSDQQPSMVDGNLHE